MPNFVVDVRQDLFYACGWPSRIVRAIWRVKRAQKRAYASFRRFSCAIAHNFLSDPDFDVKNAKLSWMSVKTFSMHTVGHHGLSGPFGGSNEPRSEHTPHFDDFHFLGDPDSDVKNAKFFRGRLSRSCLCIRLSITACPTHLEGQTCPKASIRLISTIFVCYSTPFFG